ncbi:MAG TPA: 50S ribosomal protein L23 [Trueperaceae bacterium]|nr:50S ribosomal protein L23 [Trueperaceae bacterium]
MNPHDVILAPVLSEKAVSVIESGKYTFFVHPDANRTQIKEAIETVFEVGVTKINLVRVGGKVKRQGKYQGRTVDRLKAIVTLKAGQRIEQLDGLS